MWGLRELRADSEIEKNGDFVTIMDLYIYIYFFHLWKDLFIY